jgi:site-specific recombinase XerD
MTPENEALYRSWQRKRKGEGFAELPRNRQALASLERHCGKALTAVTRDDILAWAGEGLEGMAESSRATYWSSARAFYNWASSPEEEVIARSPMDRMRQPKISAVPVAVPPEDLVRQLITATERDRSPIGRRDAAMLRLMCDTGGPRATEVATMRIAGDPGSLGLDLGRDTVTVTGKGGKVRTWPIAARTASSAERWLRCRAGLPAAARHDGALWVTFRSTGRPLTRSGVGDILERRCDAAGIARLHPHQLRHFSYHHFLKRGGRLNDAMLLYGWDDDTMPRRYAAALAQERSIEAGHALAIGDQW